MARFMKRKSLPYRIFTTYLTLMVVMMLTGIGVPVSAAASVAPELWEANPPAVPTLPPLDHIWPGSTEFKIDNAPANGVYLGDDITISNATSMEFDWAASSDIIVVAVVVKGGPNSFIYRYGPDGSSGDADLIAPNNPGGNQAEISHVRFFYKLKPAPEVVTKSFELTYANAPEGATFFARYWLDGVQQSDVVLSSGSGSKYAGSVNLPHGSTITQVEWFADFGGSDILLEGETLSEELTEDLTNKFEYESKISGMKFNDLNGDGVKDSGESGLSGWTIQLYRGEVLYAEADTGEGGSYTFVNPLPGSYTISEVMQDGWSQTLAPDNPITVSHDREAKGLKFGNTAVPEVVTKSFELTYANAPEGATFFARYWLDGVQQSDVVLSSGSGSKYAGSVNLPHGSTITQVEWFADFGGSDILLEGETLSEELTEDLTNKFEYESKISGMKFNDLNGDRTRDHNEPGLSGWTIELHRGEVLYAEAVTGEGGSYTFVNPLPGSYTISEVMQDDWYQTLAPDNPIAVSHGKEIEGLEFGNVSSETSVTIDKSGPDFAYVGDEITYTITVTNTGDSDLWHVHITDPMLGIDHTLPSLAAGAFHTITATYTVSAEDADPLPNTADVLALNIFEGMLGDSDDHIVDILKPAISLEKSVDSGAVIVGGQVTYTFVVTNSGEETLTAVVLDDPLLAYSEEIGTLNPGQSVTFTHEATVTQTTVNTATVSGWDPREREVASDSEATVVVVNPAITVEKSADREIVPVGESVTYTFRVTNTGDVPLFQVRVFDDHLGEIALITELGVAENQTFTRTVALSEPTTNIVTATGADEWGNEVSDTDTVFVDTETFLGFPPDLAVAKRADMSVADPGQLVTYTLTIENVGGDSAYDYTVTDTFDARYLRVVDAGGGTVSGNTITWTFAGPLAFGEVQILTYQLRVAAEMPEGTTVLDNVVVVTAPEDADTANNRSTWRVTVEVEEPFLPFTGGSILGIAALAAIAAATGTALRRRSRYVA